MSDILRFDDQVAVITGAGGGLGRAYALLFASRGAKVVVNDLGGGKSGGGMSVTTPADNVVEEIRMMGGDAVADYNSVENGEKIIETALNNFGRIDILVNNAGILRDRSFARISDTDWDMVHKVHLRGAFLVTRAAFPYMKKQNCGRIIMTSSTSGIYGNFGQANYSAAKLGLLGLSNTLAIEGRKNNIHCNTIAPTSGTRLTEGILPHDLFSQLTPELVAPIVVWLCHKSCQETGNLYEAAGGWFRQCRWEQSRGFTCSKSLKEDVTPESVRDNWDKIADFSNSLHSSENSEAMAHCMKMLEEIKGAKSTGPLQNPNLISSGPLSCVGHRLKGVSYTYEPKDTILYALSVGVSTKDEDGLKFLYEGSEDFRVLPTFALIPSQKAMMSPGFITDLPSWDIDFTKLLHGEQFVEVFDPLAPSGTLVSDAVISEVLDKGSGAVLILDVDTFNEKRKLVARSQWVVFVVGAGQFGGPRASSKQIPLDQPPDRPPNAVDTCITSVDQAALYRLNVDRNPLHIDPNFAALGGFDQPILHGLCSYGYAARAVLKHFCDNDVSKFKSIKSRFSKPVIPGQTLVTSMWQVGNRIHFETRVKENSNVCLTGGYVDTVGAVDRYSGGEMPCDLLMGRLAKKLDTDPSIAETSGDFIIWKITRDDRVISQWTFDLQSTHKIYKGLPPPTAHMKHNSTITIEENDLIALFTGKVMPQKLFLDGKMKLSGVAPNFRALSSLIASRSNL